MDIFGLTEEDYKKLPKKNSKVAKSTQNLDDLYNGIKPKTKPKIHTYKGNGKRKDYPLIDKSLPVVDYDQEIQSIQDRIDALDDRYNNMNDQNSSDHTGLNISIKRDQCAKTLANLKILADHNIPLRLSNNESIYQFAGKNDVRLFVSIKSCKIKYPSRAQWYSFYKINKLINKLNYERS